MTPSDRRLARALVVLAVTQIVGWGTLSLPAVLGDQFSRDLGLGLPAVFGGSTVMLVLMGVCAPLLGRPLVTHGARLVMAAGSLLAAPGFFLLAAAQGPVTYFLAWTVLGAAGAAMLSTVAYVMLNEIAGAGAKRSIGGLMLVTGLSSSVFWPITAALSEACGWRSAVAIYGALMLLVCLPLHYFGLPAPEPTITRDTAAAGAPQRRAPPHRSVFPLLTLATTLAGFVSWGLSVAILQIFKELGLSSERALQLGVLLGVVQVGARALDLFGGARWDGLTTGLVAAAVMPVGILILLVGGAADWAVFGFVALYGTAGGAMAVARATMPLVFYDRADYARAASRIALPQSLMAAAAPPVLASVLTAFGSRAALALALICAVCALACLGALARVHRAGQA